MMTRPPMLAALCALLATALMAACASSDDDDPDPMLVVTADAAVVMDALRIDPEVDARVEDEADADERPPPTPDEGVEPPVDARVPDPDPDQGVDPPDPPLEGAIATVTVVQQPQVPEASISVGVTRFVEPMPGAGDCQVVHVNPDRPPAEPAQLVAGPITVDGVRGGPFVFEHGGQGYQTDRAIPSELFSNGATIRASAGGALPFDLAVSAPAEVSVQSPGQLASVAGDADLTVRWNAAQGDAVLITVFPTRPLSVDAQEGEWIFCGAADTGSFTLRGADLRRTRGVSPIGQGALIAVTRTRSATARAGSSQAVLTATTSYGVVVTLE
ncbi:MAG: hypothetical protein R3F60_11405 [bacterium]